MKFKTVKLKTSKDCCQIANRHALVLRYKRSFIKWNKKFKSWRDSNPDFNAETAPPRISLFIKKEKETYENWLKKNYKRLFEEELGEWNQDKRQWPPKRTYYLFRRWFDVSFSDFILDDDAGKAIEMV